MIMSQRNGYIWLGEVWRASLTNHVVCNMNLDIPFIVENHLTFDALVGLLLKKQG